MVPPRAPSFRARNVIAHLASRPASGRDGGHRSGSAPARTPQAPNVRLRLGCVARVSARHFVAVLGAEGAGGILGERVAVSLAVRRAHERRDDLEVPFVDVGRLAPEVGQAEVDIELEQVDACGLKHVFERTDPIGRHRRFAALSSEKSRGDGACAPLAGGSSGRLGG